MLDKGERDPFWHQVIAAEIQAFEDADTDALVAAARRAAEATSTACLVAFTATGATARRMARERPLQPVLALTPNPRTAHRLTLVWGLEPRVATDPRNLDEMTEEAVEIAVALGLTKPGARILIAAGTPFGAPGAANLLRFAHAPFRT